MATAPAARMGEMIARWINGIRLDGRFKRSVLNRYQVGIKSTDYIPLLMTPLVTKTHFLNLPSFFVLSLFCSFRPNQTGNPMMIEGTAIAAKFFRGLKIFWLDKLRPHHQRDLPKYIPLSRMKTGAPSSMPNCQTIFFFLLHWRLPKKVQPVGLR